VPQSTGACRERTGTFAGREIIIKTAKVLGVSVGKLLRAGKEEYERFENLPSEMLKNAPTHLLRHYLPQSILLSGQGYS
jgi:hypothetical protein